MNINRVTIAGRLSRDPEQRFTPSGKSVVNCTVAVNRTWKTEAGEKRDEVAFIDVSMWAGVGDAFFKHHLKGASVYIEGRLHIEQWLDKNDGKKRLKWIVIGDSWQFVGAKPGDQSGTKKEPVAWAARAVVPQAQDLAVSPEVNPQPHDDEVPF